MRPEARYQDRGDRFCRADFENFLYIFFLILISGDNFFVEGQRLVTLM